MSAALERALSELAGDVAPGQRYEWSSRFGKGTLEMRVERIEQRSDGTVWAVWHDGAVTPIEFLGGSKFRRIS